MNISIPPVAIVLVTIVLSNFLISFGKSNMMKKSYIIVSSILAIIGILGIIMIRPLLISSLNKRLNKGRLDFDFVSWAIKKFDLFAVISIIATGLVIIFLFYILLTNKNNKNSIDWSIFSGFVNFFRIIIFVSMFIYSFGTINKRFDLASYILQLSIFEIFILYIPLIAKRIISLRSRL